MQKYVIVYFIDRESVPEVFSASEWPLHVTLLANFIIEKPQEDLKTELKNYALRTKPFNIMAEGKALFGPKQNIAVSLIQPNESIQKIHERLVDITAGLGVVFDEPAFMSEGYRPHATIQISSRLSDKQILTLNNFSLVDMFPNRDINQRRIIATYKLAGQ